MNKFLVRIDASPLPVLADGAMGTLLHSRGIPFDQCFDELNLDNPAIVSGIHREYLEAGAEILLTNTFGANKFKLAKHGLKDRLAEINQAGVELARKAADGLAFVAGDIGPLGVRIAPYGRIQPAEAQAAFYEQGIALIRAGVDLIVIETISDLAEIKLAIQAIRVLKIKIPIVASVTFIGDDRTAFGDSPEQVTEGLLKAGADIIGVNCSGGPAQLLRLINVMRVTDKQARLWVKPNAGWPEQVGGRIMYPADPDYFGHYLLAFCEAGASVVGGCCGTTPRHIAAMRKALLGTPRDSGVQVLRNLEIPEPSEVTETKPPSRLAQKLAAGKFVISVEMDPPRGLSTHKLIAGASLLKEAGVDVINVADNPMARMRMSPWAVCEVIQRQLGVETTLHFPTRGRNLLRVQGDLLAVHALGLRNIFVVMGDPTSIGDFPEANDDYDLVPSGLIRLIKGGFNVGMDHSGASIGEPTNFFVGAALNLNPKRVDYETSNVHRKIQAGVDFFLTQPVFRSQEGLEFLNKYSDKFGPLKQPVLAGILPLLNTRHATFLNNEIPGISIPHETFERMEKAGEDGARVGLELAVELIDKVKLWAQGIYLTPQFNRYDLVAEIIEKSSGT